MTNYIRQLRENKHETQLCVAKAMGMTRQYYAAIEKGIRKQNMDISLATKLAKHFDVPVAEFIDHVLPQQ